MLKMNIAILFNSDHPIFGGYYGYPILKRILETRVLQSESRHMRVSIGNILTHSLVAESKTPTMSFLLELCQEVYRPIEFDRLLNERLIATYGKAKVYCMLFQNMTSKIADKIHERLLPDPAYLGVMDVDFSNPIHLYLFRNGLIEAYRLFGKQCSIFYVMGENEDPDIWLKKLFEENEFNTEYEDVGARHTIFDEYDTLDHFKRVADFQKIFTKIDGVGEDLASDLVLTLEELHPKLFDAFASAARLLERAETEEDLAQAALSGRRLLEKTADYLFPPKEEKINGREIGKAQYKNRIWAYIEQTITKDKRIAPEMLTTLGEEANRLIKLFNTGLHADLKKDKVEKAFRDLVLWLKQLIDINHKQVRRPYLAYEGEMRKFFNEIRDRRKKD
jgi:hypothetical protein